MLTVAVLSSVCIKSDLFTDTAVFIALALEVVPERDLRVEEDHESIFVVFFEGFRGSTIP